MRRGRPPGKVKLSGYQQSPDSQAGELEARIEDLRKSAPNNTYVELASHAMPIINEAVDVLMKARRDLERKLGAVQYFCSQAEKGQDLALAKAHSLQGKE